MGGPATLGLPHVAEARRHAGRAVDGLTQDVGLPRMAGDVVQHVDQQPPKGVKYERISRTPDEGIEIDGRRD